MTKQRCEGCRWFLRYTSQDIGQCRRYPPTQNTKAGWLEVGAFDWCGEWADKNITPEQHERRELVRRFALAIVDGWYASGSNADPMRFVWPDEEPEDVCERAERIVNAEFTKDKEQT